MYSYQILSVLWLFTNMQKYKSLFCPDYTYKLIFSQKVNSEKGRLQKMRKPFVNSSDTLTKVDLQKIKNGDLIC